MQGHPSFDSCPAQKYLHICRFKISSKSWGGVLFGGYLYAKVSVTIPELVGLCYMFAPSSASECDKILDTFQWETPNVCSLSP